MDIVSAFRLSLNPSQPDVVSFVGGGGKTSALFRLAEAIADQGHRVITTTTTHMAASQLSLAPAAFQLPAKNAEIPWQNVEAALHQHRHCLLVGATVVHGNAHEDTHGDAWGDLYRVGRERVAGLSETQIEQLLQRASTLQIGALLIEADGSRHKPVKAPAAYEPVVPACTTLLVPVLGMDAIGRIITEEFVHRPELVKAVLTCEDTETGSRITPAQAAHLLTHPNGGAKALPPGARLLPLLNKVDLPGMLAPARLVARLLSQAGHSCLLGAMVGRTGEAVVERWGPGAVAILAAGRSSRMGRPKQVERVDGEPMVARAVRVALQSGAEAIYVVTGAYDDQVEAALHEWQLSAPNLSLVHNPRWAEGQSTSMHRALAAVPSQIHSLIFIPVDQPFVPPDLLRRLLRRWRIGNDLVVPAVQGKPRGAPALFDRLLWKELLHISGDTGGKPLIRQYQADLDMIPVSLNELVDIDTPADLSRS